MSLLASARGTLGGLLHLPACQSFHDLVLPAPYRYVHYCDNETIQGVEFKVGSTSPGSTCSCNCHVSMGPQSTPRDASLATAGPLEGCST